jgi:hypothetical protein
MRRTKVDLGDELEPNDAGHHDRQREKNVLREQTLGQISVVHHSDEE